MLNEVEIKLR